MAKRANPEAAIQRAVVQHLRTRGARGLVFLHVPQGNKLGGARNRRGVPIAGSINKGLGVRAGASDLLAWHMGRSYALELKAPGRRPTEDQLKFISDFEGAGGFACVAEGLDQALAVIELWGLLKGRAS